MHPADRTSGSPVPLSSAPREQLLARLLSRQLGRILRLVDLEVRGEAVSPEGYQRGASDQPASTAPPTQPGCRYETLVGFARTEPRFEMIHHELRRALALGQFIGPDGPLDVDGLRLRDLPLWARYPASAGDNIGSISSYCTCDCEFCFEKDTRETGMALGRAQLSLAEVDTRLRYYSHEKGVGLPLSNRFMLEPFTNPRCLEILERVHAAAPDRSITMTTNGAALTDAVVAQLAKLKPIILVISLNAGSVETRLLSMKDPTRAAAETALTAFARLREHGIPFVGSYVPWPSKPVSDLEAMIRLVDENDGVLARVCMPTWTRWTHSEPPFDQDEYWAEISAAIARARREVSVPVHIMPHMYEMHTMLPVVQGTVKYSPAAQAGVRYGDLILAVDGETVLTRPETAALLAVSYQDPDRDCVRLSLLREGQQIEVAIPHVRDVEALTYPYSCMKGSQETGAWTGSCGLFLPDGFQLTSFIQLMGTVQEFAGKRVLVFISQLAEPHFREGMAMIGGVAAIVDCAEVHVQVLRPRYWGGNTILGDLWTVGDIIAGTQEWMGATGLRPDVVVMPRTFLGDGGRDLLGQSYLSAERALDIEVRLLPCNRIMI